MATTLADLEHLDVSELATRYPHHLVDLLLGAEQTVRDAPEGEPIVGVIAYAPGQEPVEFDATLEHVRAYTPHLVAEGVALAIAVTPASWEPDRQLGLRVPANRRADQVTT